jgi:hypothetical protein
LEWLVSGTGDAFAGAGTDPVLLAHGDDDGKVEAPKIEVLRSDGTVAGHHAWWTGDLGVRVNVGTRDLRANQQVKAKTADKSAWFRLMASQAADPSMMDGGVKIDDDEIRRLASSGTVAVTAEGHSWSRKHALDFTVDSLGVLADVSQGGLKRDLTAFFAGNGTVPEWKNLPGLSVDDPMVGDLPDANSKPARYRVAGPRFGMLRDWARLGVPFSGKNVGARLPDVDASAGRASEAKALANEQPVKLAGNLRAGLQPILVEATDFSHLSTFKVPDRTPEVYQLRFHHYPRVVLWNPYNVELDFERSMIMIQGNGRQEMWTDNETLDASGQVVSRSQSEWLSFEGGRSTSFSSTDGGIANSEGYNDPYIGAYYFAIPRTTFGPGECLVFSPARQAEYDCLSPYRPGAYNLNSNELSCQVAPDPARSYYISGTDIGGGTPFVTRKFWYAPTPGWSMNGRTTPFSPPSGPVTGSSNGPRSKSKFLAVQCRYKNLLLMI